MFIVGDKNLPVYEVEMNRYNPLTNQLEHKWDYVHAQDSFEAKDRMTWIYGQMVDFLSVEIVL